MVRKQLYITEQQDRGLKRKARELGLSEAAIVRHALDETLSGRSGQGRYRPEALKRLLVHTRELAERHRLPAGYRFDRDEVYSERERRPPRR